MTVSIVVPVYNTAEYLPACLDSILAQTFTDFELLLVDDGSTDNSLQVCETYASRDARVRVFHQKNAGVSAARNHGVEQAQGDWLCYVDSDDTVSPLYLEHLVSLAQGDACLVMTSIAHSCHTNVITEDIVLYGTEIARYMLERHILVDSGPVAKLFSRQVLQRHGLQFPVGVHYGEDMVYLYTYLNFVDTVVLSTKNDYQVCVREGSLTTRYYPFESEYACFEACLCQVTQFAQRLQLPEAEQIRLVWGNKVSDAFIRCPKCLYASSNAYSWSEKMRRLKSIPPAYYHYFGIGFRSQGFSSAVIKYLISRRLFTLLLIIGSFYDRSRHAK